MKKEIADIIYKKIGGGERVGIRWTETHECTDEILKLFKVRIDEILDEMRNFDGCHSDGYREALKSVRSWLV
jgi:hypothetical protein